MGVIYLMFRGFVLLNRRLFIFNVDVLRTSRLLLFFHLVLLFNNKAIFLQFYYSRDEKNRGAGDTNSFIKKVVPQKSYKYL